MRVGIYDRWLSTLGGGERVVAAMAGAFSVEHDVDLLTHTSIDLADLFRRFGTGLPRTKLRLVPETPDYSAIIRASADYDVFVNASHLDYFRPRARRNLLFIYFPASSVGHARAVGSYNRLKVAIRRNAGRLMGDRARGLLRRVLFRDGARSTDQTAPGRLALRAFQYLSPMPNQAEILGGWDQILTVSEFSRRWIQRYWGRDSSVVYPPVDVAAFAPSLKRQWILGVGRFFAGNHNKKQDVLVGAFREVRRSRLEGWELHLAGGFRSTETNDAFLRAVQHAVAGEPAIQLHLNCHVDELRALYGASALFWHATGLGESESEHPERFEHFGITTVEAMAAGCVPLCFSGGGQSEIIRSGENGILWTTIDELVEETARLARNQSARIALADAARSRARAFDELAFRQRLADVVELGRIAGAGG